MTGDGSEDLSDNYQRLQQEWVDAEFKRLVGGYSPGATMDTVNGALGPLAIPLRILRERR